MFTGIIEEIGKVNRIIQRGDSKKLTITCKQVLTDSIIGDSISTNGVCLTIEHMTSNSFTAHVMNQTINVTTLKELKIGSKVNLERAMSIERRFGGHIVSGHVDTVGIIKDINSKNNNKIFTIEVPQNHMKHIIEKGSITIDGLSLTVFDVIKNEFKISFIPETLKSTTMGDKRINEKINIETDLIGKYVENILRRHYEHN